MKLLIVRFSSIGDIVLTTPAVRCAKQQLNAEIHYLTKPAYHSIVSSNPHVDAVHLLEEDWNGMIKKLQNQSFDYIIDLHHNLRTLRLKRSLKGVKSFSFQKLNFQKWLLTSFKINVLPKQHIVDRYLATLQPLQVTNDGKGLDYFIPDNDEVSQERIPLSHCVGYIAIVIGATYNTKKLPLHKLKDLCNRIDYPIVLLGGKEDEENGNKIAKINEIKIFNACGKFSLNESADLLRKSKLVITHDTGLMHIAAAFQKPIISVWGNTVPQFGMSPYYGDATIFSSSEKWAKQNPSFLSEVKPLYCRPCSKIGYRKCPLGHFKCMEKQDLTAIKSEVIKMLYAAS